MERITPFTDLFLEHTRKKLQIHFLVSTVSHKKNKRIAIFQPAMAMWRGFETSTSLLLYSSMWDGWENVGLGSGKKNAKVHLQHNENVNERLSQKGVLRSRIAPREEGGTFLTGDGGGATSRGKGLVWAKISSSLNHFLLQYYFKGSQIILSVQ